MIWKNPTTYVSISDLSSSSVTEKKLALVENVNIWFSGETILADTRSAALQRWMDQTRTYDIWPKDIQPKDVSSNGHLVELILIRKDNTSNTQPTSEWKIIKTDFLLTSAVKLHGFHAALTFQFCDYHAP